MLGELLLVPRSQLLEAVRASLEAWGHQPGPWARGARGFSASCRLCGAHVGVTLSRHLVFEFPDRTCEAQRAHVAELEADFAAVPPASPSRVQPAAEHQPGDAAEHDDVDDDGRGEE